MMQKGFSLIELLVVIAILGVVAGMGFVILATSLKTTSKVTVQNRVKQNGNAILDEMTRNARTAASVNIVSSTYQVKIDLCADSPCTTIITEYQCSPSPSSSVNGSITRQDYINGQPSGNAIALTNGDPINGINVKACNFSSSSSVFVIKFTLGQGIQLQTNYGDPISETFSSSVTLRSFK